jgi:hypothetical protein
MNMPTFIEVPVLNCGGAYRWININEISSFETEYFGSTTIVYFTNGTTLQVCIGSKKFERILRTAGCRLLTLGDIDLIGEPGEEGIK